MLLIQKHLDYISGLISYCNIIKTAHRITKRMQNTLSWPQHCFVVLGGSRSSGDE